jgi:hypothetical protein
MELTACVNTGCSTSVSNFVVRGGPVTTAAPTGLNCNLVNANGNRLDCNWNFVGNSQFYFIHVVQPGRGPGGGALTVAGRQVGATNVSLGIPNGLANIIVRACTGDGCGPFNPVPAVVNANFGSPPAPVLAEPLGGSLLDTGNDAPRVVFTWSLVAAANPVAYKYRLYVQDFSRGVPALDVITDNNFYGAYLNPGTRYDAIVFAVSDFNALQGPASGFLVRGRPPRSPTVTEPTVGSTITRNAQGRVKVSWTQLVNPDSTVPATIYQYYFNTAPAITGTTIDTFVEAQFPNGTWLGIVRACTTGTQCMEGSEAGWGPWNNAPGGEGGQALFTVR